MRWTAFLLLCLTVGGCTTQPVGQRCQQNADCNTDTDVCRDELSPGRDCDQRAACICCPINAAAALGYPACIPRTTTDAGTVTVTDRGMSSVTDNGVRADTGTVTPPTDSGVACTANSDCTIGNYCDSTACGGRGVCVLQPLTCGSARNFVCGCDGNTYSNACEAAQVGVRVSAPGACTTRPDAGSPIDAGFPADLGTPSDLGVTPDVSAVD